MSVINCKEDSIKAIMMEEGDSSLEPGEVKTPPHGNETTKSKGVEEALKLKCTTSQFLPNTKSVSKQETDKCAEKVRAILELDAIKRKEELERKKEQKSDTLLLKPTTKKKEHKKSNISKTDSKKIDHNDYETEKLKEPVIKKPKRKRSKHEEIKSYPKHQAEESCESMETTGGSASLPMISPMSFATPLSNMTSNFSRRFSDLNNPTSFRSYNPFVRNYRTDFRHRGDHFAAHGRTRFSRYRSQYVSGSFHAPAEQQLHSQPPHSSIQCSDLMWTKTKPSISYAFNLPERVPTKKKRNSSDQNVSKKKKNKKSKEREGSNKSLTNNKSSRKSSKRKKIRKIRETLPLHSAKKQLLSPNNELITSNVDDNSNTPENEYNEAERPICTIKKEKKSPEPISNNVSEPVKLNSIKQESKREDSKLLNQTEDLGKPQIFDMFASLTPPKQRSPSLDSKNVLTTPANVQITHKFQEIQDRIDKLLEDDDELKLEVIQASKEKLLQKSREHTENVQTAKSSKQLKISNLDDKKNIHIMGSRDKTPDRNVKHRSKEREASLPKPFDEAKRKEKTSIDIFGSKEKHDRKPKKDGKKLKPTHSKISPTCSPSLKQQKKSKTPNTKEMSSKNIKSTSKKSLLEDSPSNFTSSDLRTVDGSPDTDDYSDNWENDDEEIDINSSFQNVNHLDMSKNITCCSPSSSVADSEDSQSSAKIQSTTPKNSPPQQCLSPQVSYTPTASPKVNDENDDTNELQRLYNQFIKSVEGVEGEDIKPNEGPNEVALIKVKKEIEREQLSTSSASYSSSSSSSSDTSISSSASSSSTSSSDSASEDSNDTDTVQKEVNAASNTENMTEITSSLTSAEKQKMHFLISKDDSKINVEKDLKKLENLEANLLRIQMMRANYDSADEISDELLKMEKLFLHEKTIILNKFKESSLTNSAKKENENQNELGIPMKASVESLQSASLSKGQFVQSLQKLQNKDDNSPASNIFDTNREVIKLTISPVKLPKTSAIFEADNDMEIAKQAMETSGKSNSSVKPPKPVKEVAIVKPIMESKESPSTHHQKRRRSPMPSHHSLQSRPRIRRGRVRSLSVSPQRNGNGRCTTPQRRGAFIKQSRNRNFERRSRSRSPSVNRSLSRRSGDISPVPRKRRTLLNIDDRYRNHSPRRSSRSRSRSPSSPPARHRCDRYSRSPLPFKPPSPPTDPSSPPSDSRRNSLSPVRRSRSISRSPRKRTVSPPSKSYESNRHRSLSPKHQPYKPHSPGQSNTAYYFNNSPSRISLDARINIVLNGPSSSQDESNNSITTYEDYNNYGQYGPAAYMSLPSDSNSFYTNQYVPVQPTHAIHTTYSNLPSVANDQSDLFSSVSHQANVNASNFYYNRFGSQPFGLNAPSPLLKELPKATVAVQKGNVLEIVPCSDLLTNIVAEHTNENKKGNFNQQVMDEATNSNNGKGKRSILKPFDGETNSSRSAFVKAPKKKKVNFEDGVFPNHNSDDEDRKVVEAKIRVKMRRLKKKLGVMHPCHNLFEDKARRAKQKAKSDKKTPPPPPPSGLVPPNLEQPIYLRAHTPTPLLYFHFDGVVHSMYVSQMERPIPPRLLNPKCVSTTNISVVSQNSEAQSPLYMQSPISGGAPHLHSSKKDPISTFTRPNRTENISPKVIPSTMPISMQQQATGSPKINFKLYSPIESIHHTEIGSATLPSTSPNSIKGNAIHTISSTTVGNHFLPKRQESPKDVVSTRTNISMGLLPTPISHPSVPTQGTGIATHTRIPVIGVPPTVIPKVSISEPFMSGGFASTMMQTSHHPINNFSQSYMVPPPIAHINNPHMTGGVQQYFNSPVQRMHRPPPNYIVQQPQSSPTPSNLPMCHLVDPMETANTDVEKFSNPQAMAIPYNFKAP